MASFNFKKQWWLQVQEVMAMIECKERGMALQ
jgi:hypothetical protein